MINKRHFICKLAYRRRLLDVPARRVPVGEGEVELLVPPQRTLARQDPLPRSTLEPLFPF